MSTGKTNLTSTQFAAKKLLGKAHTSNLKGDVNEAIPSSVSIVSDGVFSEPIPNDPVNQMYVRSSASVGDPQTVEKIFLDNDQLFLGENNLIFNFSHKSSNSGTLCKVAIFTEKNFVNEGIIRNTSLSAPPIAAKLPFATIKLGRTSSSNSE